MRACVCRGNYVRGCADARGDQRHEEIDHQARVTDTTVVRCLKWVLQTTLQEHEASETLSGLCSPNDLHFKANDGHDFDGHDFASGSVLLTTDRSRLPLDCSS